jgi:hypothetical protein
LSQWHFPKRKEWVIGTASAGFFLVLIGALFLTTPGLFDKTLDFFRNYLTPEDKLNLVPVFPDIESFVLPTPVNPETHTTVYSAVMLFSMVWGIFQILVVAARFALGSPMTKKAETASDIVFWLGTAYFIKTMLIDTTTWFEFWAVLIMLGGVSLIVRAIILAVGRVRTH